MRNIVIKIHDRDYLISCEEGEERRVQALAQNLDQRVRELGQAIGQVGDARLLVITAIMILDELEANQVRYEEVLNSGLNHADQDNDDQEEAFLMAQVEKDQRIQRYEQLIGKLSEAITAGGVRVDKLREQWEEFLLPFEASTPASDDRMKADEDDDAALGEDDRHNG